ncbi:MAG: D-alanyl-D-alanine carboxypeptidase family protein [Sphingomonadaceae bacterium]|nr:D-alanyl-D-alanine carboxypeptidase [Sphingomonadaceae bacterium]
MTHWVRICFALLALAFAPRLEARPLQAPTQQWSVAPVADAPIALLVEVPSGQVLYAREPDRRFIPASVTKVMTAYTVFEQIKAGKLSTSTEFLVPDAVAQEWSGKGSTMFLVAGDKLPLETLLRGITTISANDASIVVAEGAGGSVLQWTALMNRQARALGMADSHFGTPNGWPDGGATFTTAADLVKLATALTTRHPALYRSYFGQFDFGYRGVGMRNHDPLIGVVKGADGIKTGFTNQAGHNFLGSAERNGRRLVMVVAGIDSEESRARISRELVEWGFDMFERKEIYAAGEQIGFAQVQDGTSAAVALSSTSPVNVALPRAKAGVRLAITYDGPLRAPVRKGEQVAMLEVTIDGMPPYTVPLIASDTVEKASIFSRIANGIRGWLA